MHERTGFVNLICKLKEHCKTIGNSMGAYRIIIIGSKSNTVLSYLAYGTGAPIFKKSIGT